MKKFILALSTLALTAPAYAGTCHGTKAPTVIKEEVDVKVEVVEPAPVVVKEKVEVDVVEGPSSIVAPPQNVGLVRRNANREARATVRAAVQAKRAAKFAAKAGDAAGQEARQEAVMKAYQQ